MTTKSGSWFLQLFRGNSSDMWQRWLPLWHTAFYVQVAIAFGLLLSEGEAIVYPPSVWGLLHIAFIAWYSLSIRYDPIWWRQNQLKFAIYLLVGWSLWWAMVSASDSYFILLTGMFPQLFIYLDIRNAIIGAVLLNALVLARLSQIFPEYVSTWLIMILITTTGSIILAYFINAIINQSHERRRLIEELQATREQLTEAERLAGVAQERQRLAADLHDTLVQSLISVVTHLEAAETVNDNSTQVNTHLQTAKQAARDSLNDARHAIWDLRGPSYDAESFHEAIRQVCHQWKQRSNLPIEFTQAGDPIILSEEIQHAILRILQEALANISRHASAKQVFITLKFTDDSIKLFIMDDGSGFNLEAIRPGNGITNMRHRAESLGGKLLIESVSGAGTTITAIFPKQLIVKRVQDDD